MGPETDRRWLGAILSVQSVLLFAALWRVADQMNPDGLGYLRSAEYLATGRFTLGINGYWGPLLSWTVLPQLLAGIEPQVAARVSLGVFALLLTVGADAVFTVLGLSVHARWALVTATALNGVAWAAFGIGADLHQAALLVWLAWALLTPRRTVGPLPIEAVAGVVAAFGAFAKPMGLQLAICLFLGTWGLRCLLGDLTWREGTRRCAVALLAMAATLAPWVLALSMRYGEFTISRSAGLNHAMLNPRVVHAWNVPSFTDVHAPPLGRITSWEDCTEAPRYKHLAWSPLDSPESMKRQLALARFTVVRTRDMLREIDVTGLGLVSVFLVPALALFRPRDAHPWRDTWLTVVPFILLAAYLPFLVHARYLWCEWTIVLAALGVLYDRLAGGDTPPGLPLPDFGRFVLAFVVLGGPVGAASMSVAEVFSSPPQTDLSWSRLLAEVVRERSADGPIVSWSPYVTKGYDTEGLYLAWELEQPWLGHISVAIDAPMPGDPPLDEGALRRQEQDLLAEAEALGARLLVVKTRLREPPEHEIAEGLDWLPTTRTPESVTQPPSWLLEPARWRPLYDVEVRSGTYRSGHLWLYERVGS